MQSCLEISMGSWPALCTAKFITHYTIHHTSSVLATKQTLLSVLLANHALLEDLFHRMKIPRWMHKSKLKARGTTGELDESEV